MQLRTKRETIGVGLLGVIWEWVKFALMFYSNVQIAGENIKLLYSNVRLVSKPRPRPEKKSQKISSHSQTASYPFSLKKKTSYRTHGNGARHCSYILGKKSENRILWAKLMWEGYVREFCKLVVMLIIQHNCRESYEGSVIPLEMSLSIEAGMLMVQEPFISCWKIYHNGLNFECPSRERKE